MTGFRKMPPFDQSLAAILQTTKDAVLAPMRPKLREHDITEAQWRVLRVLNDRAATDATRLAVVARLHSPSVTRILKDLEERKLIERERDLDDRRHALVGLTAEGRALVKLLSRDVVRVMHEFSERFGTDRLERLTTELLALAAAIKGVE